MKLFAVLSTAQALDLSMYMLKTIASHGSWSIKEYHNMMQAIEEVKLQNDFLFAPVNKKPICDICTQRKAENPDVVVCEAVYDAKLEGIAWANVCEYHFALYGCKLGTGFGSKL